MESNIDFDNVIIDMNKWPEINPEEKRKYFTKCLLKKYALRGYNGTPARIGRFIVSKEVIDLGDIGKDI